MHAYYYNYDFNDFVFRLSAGLVTLPQLFTEVANHTFATAWAGSGYKTEYGEQISGYAYLLHFDPSEYSDGYCFSW
jgi:hypothetical protein